MKLIELYGSSHQYRVAVFMRRAGQSVPNGLVIPDMETRRLRARLRLEEAMEEIEALGCRIVYRDDGLGPTPEIVCDGECNLIEVIDGVCDNSVIGAGTLAAFGLPDVPFLEEVDRSNLAKLDGGWTDENGKFRKPANWTPPDIAGVLAHIQGDERKC